MNIRAAMEIAREFFPTYNDSQLAWVVWNATSFPFLPTFVDVSAEVDLRAQLERYKRDDS